MRLETPLLAAALALACAASQAVTLRVANVGDVQSMDPHSLNETLQLSFTASVYEPLVGRGKDMALAPLLATKWTQTSANVWRFELRKGVKFHDGTPFTADDVVFSFARAADPGGDMRGYTASFKEVRKIDDHTVEIETTAPSPILPDVISNVYMMSKKWSEANKAERPVDRRKGIENTASFKADGTGPFRLKERQPGTRTVLVRNLNYWDKVDTNVDEVVFTPIGSDATRVAALLSGEIDVMEPVPLQDVERVKARTWSCCRGPSCAPSSSSWTRSATNCCSRASRARTRSRTCAFARRSTRQSTSRRSRRR
jgi:peptide/nickel transport system substrate-binding protein